jgi:hypothetical protein
MPRRHSPINTIGDELSFINRTTGEEFTRARIVAIHEKKLGEIDEADFDEGHERYESSEKMLEEYQSYYGDMVTMDTMVKLIKFEILNQES